MGRQHEIARVQTSSSYLHGTVKDDLVIFQFPVRRKIKGEGLKEVCIGWLRLSKEGIVELVDVVEQKLKSRPPDRLRKFQLKHEGLILNQR